MSSDDFLPDLTPETYEALNEELETKETQFETFLGYYDTQTTEIVHAIRNQALAGAKIDLTSIMHLPSKLAGKTFEMVDVWQTKTQLIEAHQRFSQTPERALDQQEWARFQAHQALNSDHSWQAFGESLTAILFGANSQFIDVHEKLNEICKELNQDVFPTDKIQALVDRLGPAVPGTQVSPLREKEFNQQGLATLLSYKPDQAYLGRFANNGTRYVVFAFHESNVVIAEPFDLNRGNATYFVNLNKTDQDWRYYLLERSKSAAKHETQGTDIVASMNHNDSWQQRLEAQCQQMGLRKGV